MKCVVCNLRQADQEHHVSYDPELKIPICKECHKKVHPKHGVGKGKGETILNIPFYTYMDKANTVKDLETNEVLDNMLCECTSNCGKWEIYARHDNTKHYLRCRKCGKDFLITTLEKKCIPTSNNQNLDFFNKTNEVNETR
jgi:hypothetical protein